MRKALVVLALASCSVLACGGGDGSPGPGMLVADAVLGSLRAQLVDTEQSSVLPTHIHGNLIQVVFHDPTIGMLSVHAFAMVPEGGGSYVKRWELLTTVFGEPAVGRVYAVQA